ncbi:hypothetical protein Phou_009340 [Phytohabitans houttuyneae]|uniref:Uncharacterized protein n=1 Tax=Phytohabitans houttuyneae TaxID=1076126 RepID=A0A6V8JZM5_9ACTN|nr:hypothetical protein Phou_009340 [Phytohabitans houttuyneae]
MRAVPVSTVVSARALVMGGAPAPGRTCPVPVMTAMSTASNLIFTLPSGPGTDFP